MSYIEKTTLKNHFMLSLNILHALIEKILFCAMRYKQPLHQVGFEPVTSDV